MRTRYFDFCGFASSSKIAWVSVLLAGCTGTIGGDPNPKMLGPEGAVLAPGSSPAGPGGSAGPGGQMCGAPATLGPRIRKLTDSELEQVFTKAIPGITWQGGAFGDSKASGTSFTTFADRQDLSQLVLSGALRQAKAFAALAYDDLQVSQPCLKDALPTADCVSKSLGLFAARVQHGQTESADLQVALDGYNSVLATSDAASAMKVVLASEILSPKTLFRFELAGAGGPQLTAAELAQELAFFVTGAAPDTELQALASDGTLTSSAGVYDQQVDRLLQTPEAGRQFARFFDELLHFKQVAGRPSGGPGWTSAIGADMVSETETFLRHAYSNGATLKDLFTEQVTPVSEALASYYGIPFSRVDTGTDLLPGGFDFVPVEQGKRAGILDQGSVIVGLEHAGALDPVARGHVLVDRLFCVTLGAPPAAAVATKTPFTFGMTPRDRLEVHLKDPSCNGCHSVMDPVGLAFEGFDADGRSRSMIPTYGGGPEKPVDATGTLTFLRAGPASFTNSTEFSAIVAQAPEVKECFVRNLATYALGAEAAGAGSCELEQVLSELATAADQVSLRQVMGAIVRLDLFKNRK